VGDAGGLTPLALDARTYVKSHRLRASLPKMLEAVFRYRKFPAFGLASVLTHAGFSVLPAVLLTRFYGLQEAGWYGLVNQMLVVAAGLIGLAIAQVYLSNAAQLAHSSPFQLRSLFLRTSRAAMVLGLAPFLLLTFWGPSLFGFVFGAKWLEAGRYAQLLSLPFLVMLSVGPVYPTLTVLEKLDWQFAADAIGVALMVFGMWYAHQLGLSGRWAVVAYGVSVFVTYVLLFGFALFAIQLRCRAARL
jgi:O-antigen/teichoic acid export membrane protein